MKYVKLTNKNMTNIGMKWKIGMNVDIHEFVPKECTEGGIHFCKWEDVPFWSLGYTHICDVEVPDDAQMIEFDGKCKSDKLIIKNHIPIFEHEMWKDRLFCKRARAKYPDRFDFIMSNM
jgi:hypothetical protein